MCRVDPDAERIKRKQAAVFRLARRDFDMTQHDIAEETGIHANSIGNYARSEQIMGFSSFFKLCETVPARLLSMMLPRGFQLHRVPEEVPHEAVSKLINQHIDELITEEADD